MSIALVDLPVDALPPCQPHSVDCILSCYLCCESGGLGLKGAGMSMCGSEQYCAWALQSSER